jgi:transcriptional regulator with XRE-family HTH domain
MSKRRGLTQREVAQAMGVTVGRVSQIENGELSGIDVLDRYITAATSHPDARTGTGAADHVGG